MSIFKSVPIVHQHQGVAHRSSVAGRRFAVSHQTPGTAITGQTSFVATTPTFLIRQAAAARRLILSNFYLAQAGSLAGGLIYAAIFIDSADRYSSGGTAITPQNMNADDSTAAEFTARYNPTASVAGTGTRKVWEGTFRADVTSPDNPNGDYLDGLMIGTTGSFLIYTWAATTGPSWIPTFELCVEE